MGGQALDKLRKEVAYVTNDILVICIGQMGTTNKDLYIEPNTNVIHIFYVDNVVKNLAY